MNPDALAVPVLLHDVTRHLRTAFDRRAAGFGLTRAQWRALKLIGREEGLSQRDLAERLEMDPIPVGRVVDRLEKAAFVARRADPVDRRRWRLHLTPQARAVVDRMDVLGQTLTQEALHGVSEQDLAAFVRVGEAMKSNLIELLTLPSGTHP